MPHESHTARRPSLLVEWDDGTRRTYIFDSVDDRERFIEENAALWADFHRTTSAEAVAL